MKKTTFFGLGILMIIILINSSPDVFALQCESYGNNDVACLQAKCFFNDVTNLCQSNPVANSNSLCGNGAIDPSAGETCDWNSTKAIINYTDCAIYNSSFAADIISCNESCQVNITNCKLKPANTNTGTGSTLQSTLPNGWFGDNNWTVTNKMLNATKANIVITSRPFILGKDKNYTFSIFTSASGINVLLNGSSDSIQVPITAGSFNTSISISSSDNYTLVLTATTANILIDNISLYEQSTVALDSHPSITNVAGCCYDSYCWNGNTCVNSLNYTNDSYKPPLWSSIFNTTWTNHHINYSAHDWARGYRCIINDSTSLYANWTISNIKYDWNFNESGYCSYPTDCFVGKDFDYSPTDRFKGCIPDGSFIDGKNSQDKDVKGDHYCYQGNWTTRTHVMALQLLNITRAKYPTSAFRLFCDGPLIALNNAADPLVNPTSACTLLVRDANNKEHMIIAFTTDQDYLLTARVIIKDRYENAQLVGVSNIYTKANSGDVLCSQLSPTAYLKCIDSADAATNANLYLYYNNQTKFFILSSVDIGGALGEQNFFESLWINIRNFFARLFGVNTNPHPSNVSLSQIGNYDKIYRLENGSISVSALQEYKYDELDTKGHTFIYLNYTGTNSTNNYFDPELLNNKNYTYVSNSNTQEFILKDSVNLWTYLTAVLRE